MICFDYIDRYLFSRLGIENPSQINKPMSIVLSNRRTKRELSYGFIHAAWIVVLKNNTIIISLPSDIEKDILDKIQQLAIDIEDNHIVSNLKTLLDLYAAKTYNKPIDSVFSDYMFACNKDTVSITKQDITAVRIKDDHIPAADGLCLPAHCFPDGIVYGVVIDNTVVSVAYAHRTGEYQDSVADIGVETAIQYRKRGYARECVIAVANHVIQKGGQAVYKCAPENFASIATAKSAGFIEYGRSLIFAVK